MQADQPPAATAPAPAVPRLILSRRDGTVVLANQDSPLVLSKAGRQEQALLRQTLFLTLSVVTQRPADHPDGGADSYGWSYKSFLQRQICFTSMTGLFSCTAGELEAQPETEDGEAPLAPGEPEAFPLAEAANQRLTSTLRAGAAARFEADRRLRVDPIFRASGVTAARAAPPPPAARPARRGPAAKGGSRG